MKHFILLILFGFFIVINAEVKVEEKQTLNEYKIEQLQKGIDELKKEIDELKKNVDDTKEKKLENKKDNESLDKRIGDISGSVDRFGIIVTSLGVLTTVLILSFGYFAYRGARNDAKVEAKKEAEDITKDWLEKDGKVKLNEIIQELQKLSEEEFTQLVNKKTTELNTLFENFKQKHEEQLHNHENEFKQKMKEHYTLEEKEEIEKEAKISQGKEIKTFDDYWNIILQHYKNKEYDDILNVIVEAEKLENLTGNQKGELYFAKGFMYQNKKFDEKAEEYYKKAIDIKNNDALNNLGVLYKEQKKYLKAEEYFFKAIESGNNGALINLGNLYKEQKEYNKAEEYYLKAIDVGINDALNNLAGLYYSQKEYKKAQEYFLKAIESGNNNALINLGNLYSEQKEYKKAEEYYLKAIDAGINDALNNLAGLYYLQKEYKKAEEYCSKAIESGNNNALINIGLLYNKQKEYEKAEEYYLKAIESGVNDALNSLSWMYFEQAKEKNKSFELIEESYKIEKEYANTHTYAVVLLWNEEFSKSYEMFEECMNYEESMENLSDISEYINLLIAKGQYYKAKEYFENEKYQLKDKLKPIWYALMTLMQDEFPNEIKKMGSELQESVDDILKTIEELKEKYKI